MKKHAVSLTVWFAQVLTLCALHENHTDLLTRHELDVSTTTSQPRKFTTNQDVSTKTATMTTVTSAEELLSDGMRWELSAFTSSLEDGRRNNTISTSDHNIMSLTETTVSTNSTSVMTEETETGTSPESKSINIQDMTEITTSKTSVQLDHDVQTTTSASWTEDRTSDTDEANTTGGEVPLIYSTHQTDVTQSRGSYDTTDKSPAPSTAGTFLEILSTKQTPTDVTMNTATPAGTSGHINITAKQVHSTQVISDFTDKTEEPLVSNMDWKTEENTEDLTTTPGNMCNNTTCTTGRDEAWPINSEDIRSSNKTLLRNISTSETETPAGTSGTINTTATPGHSTQVPSRQHPTEESYSTENTEEPLVSTTKMMDWKTQENTEDLTTTQVTVYDDMTNTTWRAGAWPTNTQDTWSTNSTMLKNISISETETPLWTNCLSHGSSSRSRRVSNLVCFITLWTLGMVASIFLGLTVFLWVRLSIVRKRASGRGWRDRTAKEKESLWAEPDSSNKERVEFWYAKGATAEEDKRRNRARRVRTRKDEEEDMDMWIQPKVTMKDITEFWYANGRVRNDEESQCEANEE
ncbi:mucin-2 [Tachysurus vachellii]|uniref:mucin-2 n=1 Tax=Tachysurus vachellii TaxID=175792 RepID=UPI00296B1580|nr:mucin-2 [Tachysurus vachellii]